MGFSKPMKLERLCKVLYMYVLKSISLGRKFIAFTRLSKRPMAFKRLRIVVVWIFPKGSARFTSLQDYEKRDILPNRPLGGRRSSFGAL